MATSIQKPTIAMTDPSGRDAQSPWQMPRAAWWAVAKRTWAETSNDNIGLIAAGVAFYGFLALVPLLGALVLSYGLFADPSTVVHHMTELTSVMPGEAAKLIGEQLMSVVKTSDGKKGLGLLAALALALFGARNGAGAIVTALNVAYEEEEKRGFIKVNLLSLAITASAVGVAILAVIAITAMGYLQSLLPTAPGWLLGLGKIAAYLLLTGAGAAGAATLYRYGPSRASARWMWLTPGSLLAAILWLALTIGFGIYVANFGNYDATYGSLGAVVVLLTWLYLSSYILLFGAELNSELEHQTTADTTQHDRPLGERGAWVADHVADATAAASSVQAAPAPVRKPIAGPSDYAVSRATARAVGTAGLGKVGALSSLAATLGLSLIRKRGNAGTGAAVLVAAGAVAWLGREKPDPGKVKAVLFDLDGTLVDSNGFHVDAWERAFAEHGFTVDRDAIASQIGKGGDLLVPTLLPSVDKDMVETLSERHGVIFKADYLDQVRAFPDATSLLRRVHADGQKIALASSAKKTELDHYVRLLDIKGIVDTRVTIDDVETSKPAGDIFAAALKKLDLRADQVRVVGDTPYDVEAAAKCGIATVAVRSGGFDDAGLHHAGAVALYDDVATLLAGLDASPLRH